MRKQILALIFLASLSSCIEEVDIKSEIYPEGTIFIKAGTMQSKNIIGEDRRTVLWEGGDKLSVFLMKKDGITVSPNTEFLKTEGKDLFAGKFAEGEGPSSDGETWYALYPHDPEASTIRNDGKRNVLINRSGKNYGLVIDPGTQNGPDNMSHIHPPLLGKGTADPDGDINITMKHLTGIFEVSVMNNSQEAFTVSEVKLSIDGTEKMSGTYRVNVDGDYPLLANKSGANGGNSYARLLVNNGTVPAGKTGKFYVLTSRVRLNKDSGCTRMTIDVITDKGNIQVIKPVTSPMIFNAGEIHRTKVRFIEEIEVFEHIDLNYPGLEQVKECFDNKQYAQAKVGLLDYYRNRTNIKNPGVDLSDNHLTASASNIADQALEYRFYVRNFKEKTDGKNDIYWSFKDNEGKINWRFEPPGNKDKEFNIQKHRHQWMPYLAKAYHCTKDEKYVQAWIEISRDWWESYPYKEGRETYEEYMSGSLDPEAVDYGRAWSGLQPAERLLDALDIFYYMLPAESFSPEWLSDFLMMISKTADKIMASPVKEENSNIRLAQDQALSTVAMLMPELKNSTKWMEHGTREIARHLDNQFNEDGVQNELDPGYHMGVIGNFLKVNNIAKENNLLSKFPSDYVAKLEKACSFMADIIWPNFTNDCFNDTKRHDSGVLLRNLKTYSQIFPENKEIAFLASEGNTSEPGTKVKIYDKSGYYMMQNGWKPGSMKLIHKNNYNPYNRWHCQFDNGHISVYNNGRCFTPDPGAYSYGGTEQSNSDRKDFAAASKHNTVTRNGADIPWGHGLGKFLKAESKADYELIVTENPSYDDFTHRRAIFMVNNEFYVIVDEAFGPCSTNAVLNFSLCSDDVTKGKGMDVVIYDSFPGDPSGVQAYGAHTEFSDGNNMLFRTFTQPEGGYKAEKGTCFYSEAIGKMIERKRYMVTLAKKSNQEARFITVIKPFSQPSDLQNMEISARFMNSSLPVPQGTQIEVVMDGRKYELNYSLN